MASIEREVENALLNVVSGITGVNFFTSERGTARTMPSVTVQAQIGSEEIMPFSGVFKTPATITYVARADTTARTAFDAKFYDILEQLYRDPDLASYLTDHSNITFYVAKVTGDSPAVISQNRTWSRAMTLDITATAKKDFPPSLLLHMNGNNGSTAFSDSSLNNFTMDVVGATISTAVSKFGGASGFFEDTDYIYKATSVDELKFSGDFCVEMWYYPLALDTNQCLYDASLLGQGSQREDSFALAINNSGQMYWYHDGTGNNTSASPTVNQWNFIAVTRSGSNLRVFLDGVEVLLLTNSVNFSRGGAIIGTITETAGAFSLNGYVDDVRVTKGTARYTSNFTPPTAQFPNP